MLIPQAACCCPRVLAFPPCEIRVQICERWKNRHNVLKNKNWKMRRTRKKKRNRADRKSSMYMYTMEVSNRKSYFHKIQVLYIKEGRILPTSSPFVGQHPPTYYSPWLQHVEGPFWRMIRTALQKYIRVHPKKSRVTLVSPRSEAHTIYILTLHTGSDICWMCLMGWNSPRGGSFALMPARNVTVGLVDLAHETWRFMSRL